MDIIVALRSTMNSLGQQHDRLEILSESGDIGVNIAALRRSIAVAEADHGRKPGSVSLVAVSKTMPQTAIREALQAGQRIFGENRVQESAEKWPELRAEFPDIRLHLIGALQTNKVREALRLFDVIETLDRERLAAEIAHEIARGLPAPSLLVQINTGNEPQKAGIDPREADAFILRCRQEHGLEIAGLMCIPPADQPPSGHFALLSAIAGRNGLNVLSMGMSSDYSAAIQLGATHVRIGSAIFGTRPA